MKSNELLPHSFHDSLIWQICVFAN